MPMTRRDFACVLAGAAMTPVAGDAVAASPTAPSRDSMQRILDAAGFQGVALVARGDRIERVARGLAGPAFGVANAADTRFRIASITKTMTAAAVLTLVADGRVGLDDPVSGHLPETPDAWAGISVRRLMNHSSGLADIVRLPDFPERMVRPTTLAETVDRLKTEPLIHAPGADTVYGNSGSIVAARLVEIVAGQAYPDYLRDRVYGPLGMADSGYADHERIIPRLAEGCRTTDEGLARAHFIDMSVTLGAGSEYSTVDDLHRWIVGLERGRLFPPSLVAEMFRPGPGGYGLAWQVADVDGRRLVSHVGDINGFGSYLVRAPVEDATVVILSNLEGTPVRDLGLALLDAR